MQHWLIIDLEATTEEGGWPLHEMEIIEIGATITDASGHELEHFQRFVKPLRRPLLTPFCRELTHIQQEQIDHAEPFHIVCQQFGQWLAPQLKQLNCWGSWGDYDRKHFSQQCTELGISNPLDAFPHYNLKQDFAVSRQIKRTVGLHKALQLSGLSFQGEQHRALTDARNTARLLPLIFPDKG